MEHADNAPPKPKLPPPPGLGELPYELQMLHAEVDVVVKSHAEALEELGYSDVGFWELAIWHTRARMGVKTNLGKLYMTSSCLGSYDDPGTGDLSEGEIMPRWAKTSNSPAYRQIDDVPSLANIRGVLALAYPEAGRWKNWRERWKLLDARLPEQGAQ